MDTERNQILDDFFQDFNEIVATEMKTPTTYDPSHHSVSTNIIPYSGTGEDFNLDLTQFYINTNESDFLNTNDLKTDFSNGLMPFQSTDQLIYQNVADDNSEYSVIDLSNVKATSSTTTTDIDLSENVRNDTTERQIVTVDGDQFEYSIIDRSEQPKQEIDTKISVTTPLNQYYLDYKSNSNGDNPYVTYISKDALQSVEYINECGQTETVMYVDSNPQQPDDIQQGGTAGDGITQYEIINFDDYQYADGNVETTHRTNELAQKGSSSVQYLSEHGQQTDILTTLLSDRNNKITIISKPMRNPKVRPSTDEFQTKFEAIDNNPTNITFANRPKVKGSRKQKLETINQIECDIVEAKNDRLIAVDEATPPIDTTIPETPKLPSKYMKDRQNRFQSKRKRSRKLLWDSGSDCENAGVPKKNSIN